MTGTSKRIFVDQFMYRLNQEYPETDQSPTANYQRRRMQRALDLVVEEGYSPIQAIEILQDEYRQLRKVE